MKRFTAVTWLGITLITATLSVTFAEAQERTLVVQVWSGSFERVYKTYVLEPFAKKYGVKVVSSPQGVWYGLVKLKQEVESGAPKVDVSVATYPELLRGTKENLWEPIDAEPHSADQEPLSPRRGTTRASGISSAPTVWRTAARSRSPSRGWRCGIPSTVRR